MSGDFCIRCDNALSVYCGQCVDAIRGELDAEKRISEGRAKSRLEAKTDRDIAVEEANRLRAEMRALRMRLVEVEITLEQLRFSNEMACENTPHWSCECHGCSLARDRAKRGVAGPEDER